MRYAAACAALALWSTSALAGDVRQVPHGMEVTTDAGETVRVLAYADGTFRVTVAETLPEGRPTRVPNAANPTQRLWTRRDSNDAIARLLHGSRSGRPKQLIQPGAAHLLDSNWV